MQDRNFDDIAEKFSRNIYGTTKGQLRQAILWQDLDRVLAEMGPQKLRVLDAGGGEGQTAIKMAERGHQVILCDLSAQMIDRAKQAAEALAAEEGNLLLATGAKELAQFAAIPPERLYPRVLPTLESIAACEAANIPHRNIIAMQGPFSFALNQAMMEQFHIRWLVTKDGGAAGGFDEKAAAASAAGAQLVVIRRPPEQGETASEVLKRCKEMIR